MWLDLLEITVPESTAPACEEGTLYCCQCPLGPGDVSLPLETLLFILIEPDEHLDMEPKLLELASAPVIIHVHIYP